MTNRYCEVLGIEPPRLEGVKDHRGANTFSLLIVALLEAGGPLTLERVAERFERAGIAPFDQALRSLKRCRPGRPPVYREADLYALDPHASETDLWAFRLGLRPARAPRIEVVRPAQAPLPGPDQPLTPAELEEAWREERLYGKWSVRRVVLAALDAQGRPMQPGEVVSFLETCTRWHGARADHPDFGRRGSPVAVLPDGRWALAPGNDALVRAVRGMVRDRIEQKRRWASLQPDPGVIRARIRAAERRQAARAAEMAALRRAIVHGFPPENPEAALVLDASRREIQVFAGEELAGVKRTLEGYDLIAGLRVRAFLAGLGFDPGTRRLAELGPPKKSTRIGRRGRTIRITTEMLVQGSCGIRRPLGDAATLRGYLASGARTRLLQRLEADAKSLCALYEYGRLHGAVRLRWRGLDEMIPVPWVDRCEPTIHRLARRALESGDLLEVVVGKAPPWEDPWVGARLCRVLEDPEDRFGYWIVDRESRFILDEWDIQRARVRARAADG